MLITTPEVGQMVYSADVSITDGKCQAGATAWITVRRHGNPYFIRADENRSDPVNEAFLPAQLPPLYDNAVEATAIRLEEMIDARTDEIGFLHDAAVSMQEDQ